jgi:hypothetical protein
MGLEPEYERALDYVDKMQFDIANDGHAPFFETAIRYLGGLVSAHALATSNIIGSLGSTSNGACCALVPSTLANLMPLCVVLSFRRNFAEFQFQVCRP